jgi:hypothetical protein
MSMFRQVAALALLPFVAVAFTFIPLNYGTFTFSTSLHMTMTTVTPPCTVGVVGSGYICLLTAKMAANKGYNVWTIYPSGEEENFQQLLGTIPDNLQLIAASNDSQWAPKLKDSSALLIAVDADSPMDVHTLEYLVNPTSSPNLKRVVAMSRNLNGKDMGFFVSASKRAANAQVWDGSTANEYKAFETTLKHQVNMLQKNAQYTIVRAGTLKGGACGQDGEFDTFALTKHFYTQMQKDIVNWQLLFDCKCRGVVLKKGDYMSGPGAKAVFTSTSPDACAGDSGRAGVAEAMVKSLSHQEAGNVDFGIGTAESRTPPGEQEWETLFGVL